MVSFTEALELLLQNLRVAGVERCRLEDAAGRVLRETLVADRDFPSFDRVMMDGYALRSSDWQAGCRDFRITGSAPAGSARTILCEATETCIEVMTGAPCPLGADVIIPVEEARGKTSESVTFCETADPVAGRWIHRAASDAVAGQILLEPGSWLGSREIGVAASCGAVWLEVSKLPSIAVIATGDELVAVDEEPAPHQIRQSNAHSIAAALRRAGYACDFVGVLKDEVAVARRAMAERLAAQDWLILTGAISQGARDFVPSLLDELGCRKLFHGVAQRPGKPAGCWIGPAGQVIMALPGNPVSALTGLHAFVLSGLAVAAGLPRPRQRQVILEDRQSQLPGMTRHLPVTLRADGRAEPAATGNSGDFIGLLRSDGFLTLPPRSGVAIAPAYPFTPWL